METTAPIDDPADSAGFWIRYGAFSVDGIILFCAQLIAVAVLALLHLPRGLVFLLALLIRPIYFTYMTGSCAGQTLGKKIAGIAVVRGGEGILGLGRACARYFCYFLSGLPLGAGFLAAAFTRNKRALHDYIVDTRVVRLHPISKARKAALVVAGLAPAALALILVMAANYASKLDPSAPSGLSQEKIQQLSTLSQEAGNRASLGLLRSLAAAYRQKSGTFPTDLKELFPSQEFKDIPLLQLANHGSTNAVQPYGAEICSGSRIDPARLKDTGKWGYAADKNSPCWGAIFIDCTHADSQGRPWHQN